MVFVFLVLLLNTNINVIIKIFMISLVIASEDLNKTKYISVSHIKSVTIR